MEQEKVFSMGVGKVFPLLIAKAERKGRTQQEVCAAIGWLTGYTEEEILEKISQNITYKQFFEQAPQMNPHYEKITGSICGVKIQEIEDPLMRKIRCLDKLVDELAKGKTLEKCLKAYEGI